MDKVEEYMSGLIWAWAKAKADVRQNTKILLKFNVKDSEYLECAGRMKVLGKCEDALIELEGRPGISIPQELKSFIDSRIDKGSCSCWYSSSMPEHDECKRKIERFFRTEDDLVRYAYAVCQPA